MSKDNKEDPVLWCQRILLAHGIEISIDEIAGKSRVARINYHRALVVFMLRKKGFKLTYIGSLINRNHATVLNLIKYSTRKQGRNPEYGEVVRNIENERLDISIERRIKIHEEAILDLKIELLEQKLANLQRR